MTTDSKRTISKTLPRVADFLIIGSMKAGTTTLFRDLESHPQVFFPVDKEPSALCDPKILTSEGRAAYAKLFSRATARQLCGEASTAYTKRPTYEGMAERAVQTLPSHAKILMIVREPVARVLSQHRHELYAKQIATHSIDEAIHCHPRLIEYSKYAMQVQPWIEQFGRTQVRIVQFESYIADRIHQAAKVQEFLGLEPRPDLINEQARFNVREESRIATGNWRRFLLGNFYRTLVRPLLPSGIKEAARQRLLPAAEFLPDPPNEASLQRILDAVRDDSQELAEIMNLPSPLWDEAAVRNKISQSRNDSLQSGKASLS